MSDRREPKDANQAVSGEASERATQAPTHIRQEQETLPPTVAAPGSGGTEAMPERFGRYRIVKELGRGGMGSVYLAEDTELRRQVALKIPKFMQQESSELMERFYREARAAATLNHPNICQVHDIGEHEGTRYISMAYISGPPLSKLVGTPKLRSERVIAKLMRKIAMGLAAAHSKGILHRDLKPGNIVLDERNEPVIMDFGLARQVGHGEEERLTQDGTILGTPAYMSPEQVSGDPDAIGQASDVYSLGVILYELLTGQVPYRGPITSVIGQIIRGRPKRPSELRPELDKRLEAICLKMMAGSADRRYATAKQAAAALSQYLEQTATDGQSAVSQSSGVQAKLEEHKQQTIGLLRQGQFREAAARLQKLAAVGGAAAEPYAQWARAELARVQAMPQEALAKGPELVAEAIQLLAQQEYARVIELLESVPESYRSAEAAQLLKQAQELKAEADRLNARMQQAVRDRQYEGLREKVLGRLLEIEPGNLMARDLYERLSSYGPGEQLRFDKTGMLLPAGGKDQWSQRVARVSYRPMAQRPARRAKGGQRKGEQAPADQARRTRPLIPISVGLGVLGVVGLLVLVALLVSRTPQGTVLVELDEPNAVVSVDGGKLQYTTSADGQPLEIALDEGEHKLTIHREGFEPYTRQLMVKRGAKETVQIDLATGAIRETVGPPGTAVASSGEASEANVTESQTSRPARAFDGNLADTTWQVTDSDGDQYVFMFQPGGVLHYEADRGVRKNGTWKRNDDSLEIETNNHYANFQGTIADGAITGQGSSRNGRSWTWRAALR